MTSKLFWADVTLPKNYTSQSILTGREGGGGVMKIKNMRLEYMRKKRSKKSDVGIYGKTNSQYFINYFLSIPPIEKDKVIEMIGYSPQLAYVVLKWAIGSGVIIKSYLVADKEFNYFQGCNFGLEDFELVRFSSKSKTHVVVRRNMFIDIGIDNMPPRKSSLKEYNGIERCSLQVYPVLDFIMEKMKQSTDMKNYLFNLAEKQGLIIYDTRTSRWHGVDYGL